MKFNRNVKIKIDPFTKISINDNFFLWKDVLTTQLKDWEIDYERDSPA